MKTLYFISGPMGVGKTAVSRSLAYLPLYEAMDSIKLDTTKLSPAEAAQQIIRTGDTL